MPDDKGTTPEEAKSMPPPEFQAVLITEMRHVKEGITTINKENAHQWAAIGHLRDANEKDRREVDASIANTQKTLNGKIENSKNWNRILIVIGGVLAVLMGAAILLLQKALVL